MDYAEAGTLKNSGKSLQIQKSTKNLEINAITHHAVDDILQED